MTNPQLRKELKPGQYFVTVGSDGLVSYPSELNPWIDGLTDKAVQDARIDELKNIVPPEQSAEYLRLAGQEPCVICGFNSEEFRRYLEARIEALKGGSL